jgi:hypothetical protein
MPVGVNIEYWSLGGNLLIETPFLEHYFTIYSKELKTLLALYMYTRIILSHI